MTRFGAAQPEALRCSWHTVYLLLGLCTVRHCPTVAVMILAQRLMVTSSLLHDHMHCQLHFSFLSEVHLTSEVLPGQGGATVSLLRALSLDQSMPDVRVTDGLILADGMVGVFVSGQVCFEGGQSPCGCALPLSSFLTTISNLPCTWENISYDTQQSLSCAVPSRWRAALLLGVFWLHPRHQTSTRNSPCPLGGRILVLWPFACYLE